MEDEALKALHPLYREWCREDDDEPRDEFAIAEDKNDFWEGR